ncbi:MAG: N-acetylmuramoyl-L-alanine amidase [Pseudomonadota bacterium]
MIWRSRHLDHPSPNYGERRGVTQPDMVVLHYTGMASAEAAIARLCDPEAEVSAHYLIDQDGRRVKLVRPRHRAWHAGVSSWGGVQDVNSHSIGIELVNPGIGGPYTPFPEPQMAQLEALLAHLIERFKIPPERVVGHACVAPGRKQDPGGKFDWRRLARRGLAVWRDPVAEAAEAEAPASAARFQRAARRFGYLCPDGESWCAGTLAVWQAFRMRFLPQLGEAAPDAAAVAHLESLAETWPCQLSAET